MWWTCWQDWAIAMPLSGFVISVWKMVLRPRDFLSITLPRKEQWKAFGYMTVNAIAFTTLGLWVSGLTALLGACGWAYVAGRRARG